MNNSLGQQSISKLNAIGDYDFVGDTTVVVKTSDTEYSVTDNGEEVPNLSASDAAKLIDENLNNG